MTVLTKGIDWGTQLSSNEVSYFLPSAGGTYRTVIGPLRSYEWSTYEKQQFAQAFDTFETFTNLSFSRASTREAADLTLVKWAGQDDLGIFAPPGYGPTAGTGAFNFRGAGWDETRPGHGLEQGGYGFITMIHELAHGLGLAHPHDRGGASTVFPGVRNDSDPGHLGLNQGVHTTMSYVDGWATAPHGRSPSRDYGYQGTPMAIDIAVLQAKYGANLSHRTGDDVYVLPTANEAGTFYSCLWDAGGIDTIRAGDTSRNATIDLRAATLRAEEGGGGWMSYNAGIHGGFTVANGVTIENAVGAAGNDMITGNAGANVLDGHQGVDRLVGRGGDDILLGGVGDDRLSGAAGRDRLTGGAGDDTMAGGADARDVFVYEVTADSRGPLGDLILGFEHRIDLIDLSSVRAGRFRFTGERDAFNAGDAPELRYEHEAGVTHLYGDENGDCVVDIHIRLEGRIDLSGADFVL